MVTPESHEAAQEPNPASPQQQAPVAPNATETLPDQPQPPKKKTWFALGALWIGIAAFLFGLVPVLGALFGAAAVVLGIFALRKQQSKGMAITGIILGSVAVIVSINATAGLGAVNNASDIKPAASQSAAAEPEASATPEVAAPKAPEPVATKAPEPPAPAPAPAPAVPVEYQSALKKAGSYSDSMHMSKVGIYDQLTSEYGEKFAPAAAQYAVDNLKADYNANALAKAKSYQESMSMSPSAIHDQLISQYGEKFTPAEADFAIAHLND